MQPGQPFNCTHCGAKLTWVDAPVIECEYCHTRILMRGGQPQTAPRIATPTAAGKRGGNKAMLVIAAAVIGGIAIIAVRATRTKTPAATPAAVAPAAAAAPAATAPKQPKAPVKPTVGTVVLKAGEAGTNAGQLTDARALAVTPAGEIVVAEARTGRVQVFDEKGAYKRLITLPPSALTKELTVFGAGAGPDGTVVVARAGDLLVLDVAAGTLEKTIRGDYPEVFYHGDVDVVPDGSIWAVTDRTGDLNLVHLSPAGKIIAQHKKIGVGNVAVDGVGTMYLTKRFDAVVEVRDSKAEVLRKFSQAGTGKLSSPGPIVVDGKGHVFVAENNRVLVFDPDGAFIADLDVDSVSDLAVDSKGMLYVLSRDHVTKYQLTLPSGPGN